MAVYDLFTKARLPRLPLLFSVLETLCVLAPRVKSDDIYDRFDELWRAAELEAVTYQSDDSAMPTGRLESSADAGSAPVRLDPSAHSGDEKAVDATPPDTMTNLAELADRLSSEVVRKILAKLDLEGAQSGPDASRAEITSIDEVKESPDKASDSDDQSSLTAPQSTVSASNSELGSEVEVAMEGANSVGSESAESAEPEGSSSSPPAGTDGGDGLSGDGIGPPDSGSWALVKAAQRGDESASAELYRLYQDVVFRYVLFRLGDATLAEDITQETFLRAIRRIGSVSYQGRDIGAWYVTLARNLIFDHVKSSRYRLESVAGNQSDMEELLTSSGDSAFDGLVDNLDLQEKLNKLLPDQREVVQLRIISGFSTAEVAVITGRSERTVQRLLARALERLRDLMAEDE